MVLCWRRWRREPVAVAVPQSGLSGVTRCGHRPAERRRRVGARPDGKELCRLSRYAAGLRHMSGVWCGAGVPGSRYPLHGFAGGHPRLSGRRLVRKRSSQAELCCWHRTGDAEAGGNGSLSSANHGCRTRRRGRRSMALRRIRRCSGGRSCRASSMRQSRLKINVTGLSEQYCSLIRRCGTHRTSGSGKH